MVQKTGNDQKLVTALSRARTAKRLIFLSGPFVRAGHILSLTLLLYAFGLIALRSLSTVNEYPVGLLKT